MIPRLSQPTLVPVTSGGGLQVCGGRFPTPECAKVWVESRQLLQNPALECLQLSDVLFQLAELLDDLELECLNIELGAAP